jgi:signal peptidase II
MYTFAPTSHARRSAQTVLWQITEALVRLVAPILSFTADEVWEYLPRCRRAAKPACICAIPQNRKEGQSSHEDPAATSPRCWNFMKSGSLISALIFLADRYTKTWVDKHIHLGGNIPIIPRVLRITHWTNEGAAFSLFANSASPHLVHWALIGFALLTALIVLVILIRLGNHITLVTVALAFILGGALGNVHDRLLYGSVIDFIEVHIFSYHWPDFNVADSAVVTGACMILLDSLLPKKAPAQ